MKVAALNWIIPEENLTLDAALFRHSATPVGIIEAFNSRIHDHWPMQSQAFAIGPNFFTDAYADPRADANCPEIWHFLLEQLDLQLLSRTFLCTDSILVAQPSKYAELTAGHMQAKLAVAEAAAQEGAEQAGGALEEAQGQIEATLGKYNALEAECIQLRRSEEDLRVALESAQAECLTREAELQAESERRSGLDLELAKSQEALDESRMLHQALQQQHAHLQVPQMASATAGCHLGHLMFIRSSLPG